MKYTSFLASLLFVLIVPLTTHAAITSTLGVGSQGAQVTELQTILRDAGFLVAEPTGYFGLLTRAALVAYQQANGLEAVGYTGPRTQALLNAGVNANPVAQPTLTETLKLGSKGEQVLLLQQMLIQLGYQDVRASGTFDTRTRQAVRSFQREHDLSVTGTVSGKTRDLLNARPAPPSTPTPTPTPKPAPTLTLRAVKTSINAGDTAIILWTTANATSCTASGGWSGSRATSGTQSFEKLSTSTTYTLSCTGPGGSVQQSVAVAVKGTPTTTPAPTVSLSASASSVASGGKATLTWSSTNATSCTASGGWYGQKAVSGNQDMSNLTSDSSYTLTCTGAGGTAAKTVQVSVKAPPASSTGSYPAGVVKGGLQKVWDLRKTAGLTSTPTLKPATHASSLPAGTTVGVVGNNGMKVISVRQSADFTGWDFTGYQVAVEGDITVTFTNCKFANPNGYAVLDMGVESTAPKVTVRNSEFDLTDVQTLFESPIRPSGKSTFTMENSHLHDASNDYISFTSSGTMRLTRNFFEAAGVKSSKDAHLEIVHIYGGTSYYVENLFDISDGVGRVAGGYTAVLFPEPYSSNLTATFERNIITGVTAMKLLYPVQTSAGKYGSTQTWNGNVVQRGSSAYMANGTGAASTMATINQSGNINLDTGAEFDFRWAPWGTGLQYPGAVGAAVNSEALSSLYGELLETLQRMLKK